MTDIMEMTRTSAARRTVLVLCAALFTTTVWLGAAPTVPAQPVTDPQAPVAAPPPASATGRLLFTRDGGLWLLRLGEGQQLTQVIARPRVGMILTARWSPDGSRFVFTQYEVPADRNIPVSSLVVAAADGSDRRTIVTGDEPGTQLQVPRWSPDGRAIYFLHRRAGLAESIQRLERVDLATGERTIAAQVYGDFDLSADGRWLAIVQAPGGKPSLTLIDLQSGNATPAPLLDPGLFDALAAPRFDPTSQTVLFSGLRWADASQPAGFAQLSSSPIDVLRPAVAQAHGLPMDLYTIPVAGGTPRRLTKLMLDDPVSTWAPDGAQLAVLSAEFLALTPAAEGNLTPILTPGAYGSVDWAR
jgi:Tol biopolymer transport system component